MKQAFLLGLFSVLLYAFCALAAETNCPGHFAGGEAPDITNPKLKVIAREICYSGYAIKHSGITRTPIYSAEYLTRERLLQAKGVKRQNSFHPDDNIPASERAELKHYAKSGYDRGHMAPSADMPDEQSMYESFSLANMVPQNPNNNRGAWAKIESDVRTLAMKRGKLYVISGPIYSDWNQEMLKGAVGVPDKLFKAIYDPDRRDITVYVIENAADAQASLISASELEEIAGFTVFRLQRDR